MGVPLYPLTERRRPDGQPEWVWPDPPACPNGHPWSEPYSMQRGWRGCALPCAYLHGHSRWTCSTCREVVLDPPCDDPGLSARTG